MNVKLILLILLSTSYIQFGIAQNQLTTDNQTSITSTSFFDKTEFKASYFGNVFWNQALTFGAEYLWKEQIKLKNRKHRQKKIKHQFLFNGSLGFSTNFATETDTGAFTYYGLIWRRTNPKGKQISVEINPLGYYRSFLPETYKVNGDNVDNVFLPGRGYYAPSISIGFGKSRKGKKLTGRYFNLNLMLRTPYNAGTLPSISFEYGYRFNFKKKKRNAKNNF